MCHSTVAGGALHSLGASPCLGMFRGTMVDVPQLCESMCSIVGAVICLRSETQTFPLPWLPKMVHKTFYIAGSCHSSFFFFFPVSYTHKLIPIFPAEYLYWLLFCLNFLLPAVYRELLWLPNEYAVSFHPMMTFHPFSPYCFLHSTCNCLFALFSFLFPLPQLRHKLLVGLIQHGQPCV